MAMKEFTAGERLFAADLNDNFDETQLAGNILSGTFDAARIPNLSANKITSDTLNDARIPNLDASKTTSGVFNIARIPNAAKVGIGTNVVETVKSNTFTTTSTSYVDVTGLTVTITPSSATSKILVLATLQLSDAAAGGVFVELQRAGTTIFIGDAAGSRVRASGMGTGASANVLGYQMQSVTLATVDSPATTSARIYKIRMRTDGSTGTLNRFGLDGDNSSNGRVASSIVVIEVAA
jgi:hypothetical protein